MHLHHRLALALVALSLAGCLISSSTTTEATGRSVSAETLSKVKPGMSAEALAGLLGEPTSRAKPDTESEIWKWEYREVTKKEGALFLIFATEKRTESTGAVYAELQGGKVVRTWRD